MILLGTGAAPVGCHHLAFVWSLDCAWIADEMFDSCGASGVVIVKSFFFCLSYGKGAHGRQL